MQPHWAIGFKAQKLSEWLATVVKKSQMDSKIFRVDLTHLIYGITNQVSALCRVIADCKSRVLCDRLWMRTVRWSGIGII